MSPGKIATRWECSQRTGWARGFWRELGVVADLRDAPFVDDQRAVAPRAQPARLRSIDEKTADAEQGASGFIAEAGGHGAQTSGARAIWSMGRGIAGGFRHGGA